VIIGDQSVGKSSLLQSLTNIPFPVAGRLCTRFPTRIVSRRTSGLLETTRVSIEPKFFSHFPDSKVAERRTRYETFRRTFSLMTAAEFKNVIEDVGARRAKVVSSQANALQRRQTSWGLGLSQRKGSAISLMTS